MRLVNTHQDTKKFLFLVMRTFKICFLKSTFSDATFSASFKYLKFQIFQILTVGTVLLWHIAFPRTSPVTSSLHLLTPSLICPPFTPHLWQQPVCSLYIYAFGFFNISETISYFYFSV